MSPDKFRALHDRVSVFVIDQTQQSWKHFKNLSDGSKFAVAAIFGGVMTYGGLTITGQINPSPVRGPSQENARQQNQTKQVATKTAEQKTVASDKVETEKTVTKTKEAPILLPDIEKRAYLKKGESLINHLKSRGLETALIYNVLNKAKKQLNPRRLAIGTPITLIYDAENNTLKKLVIRTAFTKEVTASIDQENKLIIDEVDIKITKERRYAEGDIKESLYIDAKAKGLPDLAIHNLTNLYSYDIDFQRDIRPGSSFKISYWMHTAPKYKDQEVGAIDYAEFSLHKQNFYAYLYTDSKGKRDYFDEKGHSVRKALLKTPIDSARISSRFGMRKHPILGYSKPHRGIDFAARRGTPIKASGKGVVERANWYGAYGRYIRIRHSNGYATAYAHLNRFAKGIKKGRTVQQGDIIGYVGTTGRSTGPHLHYEVLKNNTRINPSQLKFPAERQLKGAELKNFHSYRQKVSLMVDQKSHKTALGQ